MVKGGAAVSFCADGSSVDNDAGADGKGDMVAAGAGSTESIEAGVSADAARLLAAPEKTLLVGSDDSAGRKVEVRCG
jgi:hypothetical protein